MKFLNFFNHNILSSILIFFRLIVLFIFFFRNLLRRIYNLSSLYFLVLLPKEFLVPKYNLESRSTSGILPRALIPELLSEKTFVLNSKPLFSMQFKANFSRGNIIKFRGASSWHPQIIKTPSNISHCYVTDFYPFVPFLKKCVPLSLLHKTESHVRVL